MKIPFSLSAAWFLCALGLLIPTALPAQSSTPQASPTQSSPSLCDPTRDDCAAVYPVTSASYVGGTIPALEPVLEKAKKGWIRPSGAIFRLATPQYQLSGWLVLADSELYFAFKPPRKANVSPSSANTFRITSCPSTLPDTPVTAVDKVCKKAGGKSGQAYLVSVGYDAVNGLSRAMFSSADMANERTSYLTAAVAVLSAILGTQSTTKGKELYGGVAVGVLSWIYFWDIQFPRMQENYIAVFACPSTAAHDACAPKPASGDASTNPKVTDGQPKPPCCDCCKQMQAQQPPPCAHVTSGDGGKLRCDTSNKPTNPPPFPRGELAMFRIPNHHDYFNISMILSAKKGMEFTSENAEQGGAAPSK